MIAAINVVMMTVAPRPMDTAGPHVDVVAMGPDPRRIDAGRGLMVRMAVLMPVDRGRLVVRLGMGRRRLVAIAVPDVDVASRLVDGPRSRVDVAVGRRLVVRPAWAVRIALGRRGRRVDAQ